MVDVERSYPTELAERVRESWSADAYPLPKRLVTILDVAYHASFLRDEERPVTGRILVLPSSELALDTGPPAGLLPLRFGTPRRFDEDELRRLSTKWTASSGFGGLSRVVRAGSKQRRAAARKNRRCRFASRSASFGRDIS